MGKRNEEQVHDSTAETMMNLIDMLKLYKNKNHQKAISASLVLDEIKTYVSSSIFDYLETRKKTENDALLTELLGLMNEANIDLGGFSKAFLDKKNGSNKDISALIGFLIMDWINFLFFPIRQQSETANENLHRGSFIAGLIFFGATRLHAEKVASEWLGIKYSTAKASYVLFNKENPCLSRQDYFAKSHYESVFYFREKICSPFPEFKKYITAKPAFIKLCKECDETWYRYCNE